MDKMSTNNDKKNPESETKKCLICEQELTLEDGMLQGGGFLKLSFGFGSRFDHMAFDGVNPLKMRGPLFMACAGHRDGLIRAYICDDCFEQRHHLMEAYRVRKAEKLTLLTPIDNSTQT